MRKRAHASNAPGNIGWIISFADMATILLAFLALIIGITAHDSGKIFTVHDGEGGEESRGQYIQAGGGVLMSADRSLLAPVIDLVNNLNELPPDLLFDQDEFQKAVFQLDPVKTPNFQSLSEAVENGVEFGRDNRGLIIKWDRALLFNEGEAVLTPGNLPLLEKLAAFLQAVKLPVSLESHSNPLSPLEGGTGEEAYALSFARSKALMQYLTGLGLAEERFRLGAFGGTRPRTQDPERAWENSRIEIVIYRPEASSWQGR